jgi:hypothetical protein
MKRLGVIATSAVLCAGAHAGGAWDGIYDCSVSVLGTRLQAYATINGQPDGRAIVAWPAMSATPQMIGYGIGTIAGDVLSGHTWLGFPFALTGGPDGFSYWIQAPTQNGGTITGTGQCARIW